MKKASIEEFFINDRRQWKYYCRVCGKFLHDTSHPSEHFATRDEISNLLCLNCQKKIDTGLIQDPEPDKEPK
jgi:hypothetical protein